jgi:hypothetical protein
LDKNNYHSLFFVAYCLNQTGEIQQVYSVR